MNFKVAAALDQNRKVKVAPSAVRVQQVAFDAQCKGQYNGNGRWLRGLPTS